MSGHVTIIGGGLAGVEAAWQAAERGARVSLYEMRPVQMTPAHKTGDLAELVCSNSLKADGPTTAPGLLKAEMRALGSLVMEAADQHRVPAGVALAVDRTAFSRTLTDRIGSHPRIEIYREEVKIMPACDPLILATGPLTSSALARELATLTQERYLYFYDAISPIVDGQTVDGSKTFFASRYGKGGDDYLNCGLSREEYQLFWKALLEAEKVPLHPFEKAMYFEGCLPIEEMASRGEKVLAFGPMKPVGLTHPGTGARYHAVAQLRRENTAGESYNLVGFQTKLTYPEQKRVFRMIPGLEGAAFFRYGSLHRNTFLNAPRLLQPSLQLKGHAHIFIAGQITGVEGYLESAATGWLAGVGAVHRLSGLPFPPPPPTTALGSLIHYITTADPAHFQPVNINYGLIPPVDSRAPKKERRQQIAQRALEDLERWKKDPESV